MSKKIENHFELKDVCRSAGLWYVGSFLLEFLKRKAEWQDADRKQEFIKSLYLEYPGIDDDISGTTTRANAMIRIIESDKVKDAMQLVLEANEKKLGCMESKTNVFFASAFWQKLQNIFGECCISKLEKVAKPGRQLPCQPHGHCRQYLIVTA